MCTEEVAAESTRDAQSIVANASRVLSSEAAAEELPAEEGATPNVDHAHAHHGGVVLAGAMVRRRPRSGNDYHVEISQ